MNKQDLPIKSDSLGDWQSSDSASPKTIKQMKTRLDQLLDEINEANPEDIESSTTKLKEAKQLIAQIENQLKFSEVEISDF
jgi:polyhydroxyalkanoate synthesis regulator phasin